MVYQGLTRTLLHSALCCVVLLLGACADTGTKTERLPNDAPAAPREFRAVWVASVANIDWPSRRDLSVAQQQAEIIATVERVRELNMNAIVLQVRTSADALYDSPLEPWSEYLTGEQGKAPDPYYDPLKMWVDEAHRRGIELHAWFNPYRARHPQARSPTAKSHISNTQPNAVKSYGGYLWMDPGEAAASAHTLNVILDVVRRYDIDGVHIDDYFYPYPLPVPGSEPPLASPDGTPQPRAELPFPDEPAWQAYVVSGGKLERADWRRQNVNQLIEKIYAGIKRVKAHVKFGISPFGIGKPSQRPAGIAGFSQYDKLYADAELWLQKGWLDYFTPQLYWPIDQVPQAYGVLLDYWAAQNTAQRHLWPGMFTSRINDTPKTWQPDEIVKQIVLTRSKGAADRLVSGHVHFSMVALSQNRKGINSQLAEKLYQAPALVPASPWLGSVPPAAPQLVMARDALHPHKVVLTLTSTQNGAVSRVAMWSLTDGVWRFAVLPINDAGRAEVVFDEIAGLPNRVVVSFVDRIGNEGPRVSISRQQLANALGSKWQK